MKVHQYIVSVHFPEWRKEGIPVGAAVLHFVGEVDLEIAGVPDPGLCAALKSPGASHTKESIFLKVEKDA
jgi:hypothetical protein